MNCVKCQKETQHGENYRFYYGTKTVSYSYGMGYKVKRTNYSIKGQGMAWTCDDCIKWRSHLSTGIFIVFVVTILLMAYPFLTNKMSNLFIFPIVIILFGVTVLVLPPGGQTEWGDRIAISVNKKTMKQLGHNAFLTTSQYKRLERKKVL